MKDHEIRELVNQLRDVAIKYHGAGQLREQIARTVRAAILQAQSDDDGEPTDDERIMAIEGIHNCERCGDEGWVVGEMGITRCACGQDSPVCTCPSGDGSLRWPCPSHPSNYPVIPDSSADMLRRWLTFGRGMQNAGCQLPHNLIAETESMLAATPQQQNAPQNIPEIIPGWIPVSERMPDKNQDVLISVNFDSDLVEPLICSARYTGSTFRRGDATVKPGSGVEQATHWMPLPACPYAGDSQCWATMGWHETKLEV